MLRYYGNLIFSNPVLYYDPQEAAQAAAALATHINVVLDDHSYVDYYFRRKSGMADTASGLPHAPGEDGITRNAVFIECMFTVRDWTFIDCLFINCGRGPGPGNTLQNCTFAGVTKHETVPA
jgi:hypothetical protein